MKRPQSSFIQFRKRIPADVLVMARGLPLVLPIGDETVRLTISATADTVQVSLRTRDPRDAKARHGLLAAHLERVWQGLREGPKGLTHRNAVALAGEVYRATVAAAEDDPGHPFRWAVERGLNALAERGGFGWRVPLIIGDDADRRRVSMNERFGAVLDEHLARRMLRVDDETRGRLLDAVGQAFNEAAARLGRNAEGDYSPDETARRFPEWRDPVPATPPPPRLTFDGLVKGWWTEAQAGGLTLSTLESYSATARKLSAFLRHEDAGAVTPDDVVRFKDHRLASINPRTGKPISASTVKDNDLAGLKSLYAWAVQNRRVAANPAAGITVKVGKKIKTRSKGLTDAETAAILRAANKPPGPSVRPKMAAARRWVPWLLAYTGARLGEMVQLRGQDVRLEGSVWAVNITPDAGTVKDKEARTVALHPHLVEQGFVDFVRASGPGYLFLTLGKDGDWRGPWRGVKNRIGDMAREAIGDAQVAANHGWRHRFKTVGRGVGIGDAMLDHITGHAPGSVGDSYGDFPLPAQAAAIAKMPRYSAE